MLHRRESPWQNRYIEAFGGRSRDELINTEEFGSLLEARVIVEAWRIEYKLIDPIRRSPKGQDNALALLVEHSKVPLG